MIVVSSSVGDVICEWWKNDDIIYNIPFVYSSVYIFPQGNVHYTCLQCGVNWRIPSLHKMEEGVSRAQLFPLPVHVQTSENSAESKTLPNYVWLKSYSSTKHQGHSFRATASISLSPPRNSCGVITTPVFVHNPYSLNPNATHNSC